MKEQHTVLDDDGQRQLVVTGTLLAEVTSDDGRRSDWTTIRILRSEAGTYVAWVAGLTRRPNGFEKHKTYQSATADGIIECLHLYDGDGVRYLTKLARQAIVSACDQDVDLRSAYEVEHVA